MAVKLITAAESRPVTVAEAKAHLRVDFSEDDTLIDACIRAATDEAEKFTGRALMGQVFDLYLDEFPDTNEIKIPNPPLIEVIGLFYRDNAGDEAEWAAANYAVDSASEPARIVPAYGHSWPTPREIVNAVRVRFRAGFVNEDVSPVTGEVPYAIKAAILLIIGTLYAHRETVVIGMGANLLPWSAEQLLRRYRVHTAIG